MRWRSSWVRCQELLHSVQEVLKQSPGKSFCPGSPEAAPRDVHSTLTEVMLLNPALCGSSFNFGIANSLSYLAFRKPNCIGTLKCDDSLKSKSTICSAENQEPQRAAYFRKSKIDLKNKVVLVFSHSPSPSCLITQNDITITCGSLVCLCERFCAHYVRIRARRTLGLVWRIHRYK